MTRRNVLYTLLGVLVVVTMLVSIVQVSASTWTDTFDEGSTVVGEVGGTAYINNGVLVLANETYAADSNGWIKYYFANALNTTVDNVTITFTVYPKGYPQLYVVFGLNSSLTVTTTSLAGYAFYIYLVNTSSVQIYHDSTSATFTATENVLQGSGFNITLSISGGKLTVYKNSTELCTITLPSKLFDTIVIMGRASSSNTYSPDILAVDNIAIESNTQLLGVPSTSDTSSDTNTTDTTTTTTANTTTTTNDTTSTEATTTVSDWYDNIRNYWGNLTLEQKVLIALAGLFILFVLVSAVSRR